MADILINENIESILKERMHAEYKYDGISGFPFITNVIREHCSELYDTAEANPSDGRPIEERSMYYRKQLPDGTWMRIRVGNHQPNMYQTYRNFLEDKYPTTNPYGNICLMFYGSREQQGSSWKVNDQTVRVSEDIIEHMNAFQHITFYYLPGLIRDTDAHLFNDAIDEWFSNDGNKKLDNKIPDMRVRYKPNKNAAFKDVMTNACIGYAVATISFEVIVRHINETFVGLKGNPNKIKMADAVIVNRYGAEIGTGAFYYQEKEIYLNTHSKFFDKVLSQEELDAIEFEKKYMNMDEAYQRTLREWINSQK